MENFNFKNTTEIIFGKDQINDNLHNAVSQFGKNVLFVYGGGSIKRSGLYDQVLNLLNDLEVIELAGIDPNPRIESVQEGQRLAKLHDIDVILAVGGGSVIDAAKVMASAKYYDGDAWDLVVNSGLRQEIGQLPVVDILTLAATGTEMNAGSVISNLVTKQKIGTYGPNTPAVSFLDPTLTYSVSKWQTAAGSFDIFSHLTEQYFDRANNNDVTAGMIEGVMRSVIKWAPVALAEPENYDARANLMWASTMALNGLTGLGNANGWTVHPIEHEVSAYYDITHGAGLAILTPRWMQYCLSDKTVAKFAAFGRNVWNLNGNDEEVAKEAIQVTYNWIKSLGLPTTLAGIGIEETTNFKAMAQHAVELKNLEETAYVPVSVDDVVALYQNSMTTKGFE